MRSRGRCCNRKKRCKRDSDFLEKAFLIVLSVIVGLILLKSIAKILIFLLIIAMPILIVVVTVKKYKR
ncbi:MULTISPECIES: hypothetical protein [unclassified Clostridium]|uniref:hypothetical protein n=1 Tax=unclassified Clostridium TaxID=2614128 RepID=UPI000EDF460D|nr:MULTISPECIES: hypothetical protein [unclassified Clostridium]HCQ91236.1 hypothetical protein [Clostridium sp.]